MEGPKLLSGDSVVVGAAEVIHHGFCRLEKRVIRFGGWKDSASYEYVNKPSAVAVLPYDPILNEVVIIEQFRLGSYLQHDQCGWLLETAAGIVDEGEAYEEAARRELQEETGLQSHRLLCVGDFLTSPGFSSERIYLYVAVVDASNLGCFGGLASEHEYIKLHRITPTAVFELLENNRIKSGPSLVLLQWFQLHFAALVERLR